MSTLVPLTYTTYNVGLSHARRTGERMAVCGQYFAATALARETLVPTMPLCAKCSAILAATPPQEGNTTNGQP